MANDRSGKKLHLGDVVRLIPGMRVGRFAKAMVVGIDGENISLDIWSPYCKISGVHRYGCEMTITKSFWS